MSDEPLTLRKIDEMLNSQPPCPAGCTKDGPHPFFPPRMIAQAKRAGLPVDGECVFSPATPREPTA